MVCSNAGFEFVSGTFDKVSVWMFIKKITSANIRQLGKFIH